MISSGNKSLADLRAREMAARFPAPSSQRQAFIHSVGVAPGLFCQDVPGLYPTNEPPPPLVFEKC